MLRCIPDSISSTGQFQTRTFSVSVYTNSSVQVRSVILRGISKLSLLTVPYLIHREISKHTNRFLDEIYWKTQSRSAPNVFQPLTREHSAKPEVKTLQNIL